MFAVGSGCGSGWKGGIGAVLAQDNLTKRVYVRDVPADMAAAKAGLEMDDEVLAIDETLVAGMTPEQVHGALAGSVGAKVTLTLARRGGRVKIVIERGPLRGETGRNEQK